RAPRLSCSSSATARTDLPCFVSGLRSGAAGSSATSQSSTSDRLVAVTVWAERSWKQRCTKRENRAQTPWRSEWTSQTSLHGGSTKASASATALEATPARSCTSTSATFNARRCADVSGKCRSGPRQDVLTAKYGRNQLGAGRLQVREGS